MRAGLPSPSPWRSSPCERGFERGGEDRFLVAGVIARPALAEAYRRIRRARAATLPLFLPQAPPDKVSGLIHAATLLAQLLGQGRALDSRALRSAMEAAFGGTDAEGAWVWKDAYEALEAAQVLFLRKFGVRHALARRLGRGDARDADAPRRAARVADPPLRGIRAACSNSRRRSRSALSPPKRPR